MRDILIRHDNTFIECEIDGSKLTYTWSDDPRFHVVLTLRDEHSYDGLKRKVNELFDQYDKSDDAWHIINDFLQCDERDAFFTDDMGFCYYDLRTREEMEEYEKEAFDKVWLMRSRPVNIPDPDHPKHDIMSKIERDRQAAIERIFSTYDDIPENGYSDWECGYWNGIMGALRWAMGEEKNFLDT